MHQSAMFYGRRFFETYCSPSPSPDFTVIEIGSQNVNGSLREVCPSGLKYIGLDFASGNGVDIVISDPYKLPVPDASADIVISSSCFEHSEFFWLVFLEAMRILKPEGIFYLNVPSNGFFHRLPVDCWRFYPDSGHALVNWGRRNGYNPMLLESFIGDRSEGRVSDGGMWIDFVAVFLKDKQHKEKYPYRILHTLPTFSNGYSSEKGEILNLDEYGSDFSLIQKYTELLDTKTKDLDLSVQSITERDQQIVSLKNELAHIRGKFLVSEAQLGAMIGVIGKGDFGFALQTARAHLQSGRIQEAMGVTELLLKLQGNNKDVITFLVELAIIFHNGNNLNTAENLYRQILAVDPGNVDALHLLGLIFFSKNMYHDAGKLVEQSIQLATQPPPHFFKNAGQIAVKLQDLESAERYFRQAIAANKSYMEPYVLLIELLARREKFEAARNCHKEALKHLPNHHFLPLLDHVIPPALPSSKIARPGHVTKFAKIIKLPASRLPVVSVIIPVRGKIDSTLRCLASIAENPPETAVEIIVVDDCSQDRSADILATVSGIRLFRNVQQQGFFRSSNTGARMARGSYLHFLNAETEVTPGWLDALLDTFDELPNIGMVGSKIISPDNRLHSAGCSLWKDGSASRFGRLQNSMLPAYNYAREVDFCSYASLLVQKDLFENLGSFNEHFTPSSGEDADLALKIQNMGYRTIYQPLSTVFYHGEMTSPEHADSSAQQMYERWKDVLQFHTDNATEGTDPRAMRRALFIEHTTPTPDQDAGSVSVFNLMKLLRAMGFQLTFIPENNFLYMPGYTTTLQQNGIEVLYSPFVTSVAQHLEECGDRYELVVLFRPLVIEKHLKDVRHYLPRAKVLYYTHDLHFLRMTRQAKLQLIDQKAEVTQQIQQMKEMEMAGAIGSDATILVSTEELKIFCREVPEAKLHVFPLILDVPGTTKAFAERNDIVFVGGYLHAPNVDAVRYFVSEIMPILRKQLPGVRFHAAGSNPPKEVKALACEDVIVTGFVKDLPSFLDKMRVSVAPLRFGAGIKGKVGTAMTAGLPVVATPMAVEGMLLTNRENILIAEDPKQIADAIVNLYQDEVLWKNISRNSLAFAEKTWGFDAAWRNFNEILSDMDLKPVKGSFMDMETLPLRLHVENCRSGLPSPVPTQSGEVDISVILPVFNQWNCTQACINSILESCKDISLRYEIILADDASTDETLRAAEIYPGLRVVRMTSNVGFLRNCNHAARQANGKYLLFLNNDTIVFPGWMTALYRLIEEDQNIAITGSKLLYPDGSIQEAGAILWNDGTAHNCGRGKSRHAPKFNRVREVDYVSGTSILVRKTFWDTVKGFDERYENAYCKDSDLCMTARAKGFRVMYQPKSELIHFESKSYDGDRTESLLPIQRNNIQRLFSKWQSVFTRDHLPPGTAEHIAMSQAERTPSSVDLTRRGKGRMNILYFSPFPSHPSNHGNRSTIQQFGKRFQKMGHKVHFALLQSAMYSNKDLEDMRASWDTMDILPNAHPLSANGHTIPFDGWYEEGLGEKICELCKRYDIDILFCSYVFQSKILEFVPAHILKVIDTHDKMGNRYEMLRANGQPLEFFSCTPEEEGAYLRRADIVVARREEEARYFDSVTGLSSATVFPHVEEPHFVKKIWGKVSNLGIVASANLINLAIVKEFLETVDRRLGDQSCPFTVNIAGQILDLVAGLPVQDVSIFRKPWVRMYGFVPDIAQFYRSMDLVVSPVTMGTGINVKTVQAMAYGMPLLTTASGIKGIETGNPMHIHSNLGDLVESLFGLVNSPEDLARLAALSRDRYLSFYESSLTAMAEMFMHPKLHVTDFADKDASKQPMIA